MLGVSGGLTFCTQRAWGVVQQAVPEAALKVLGVVVEQLNHGAHILSLGVAVYKVAHGLHRPVPLWVRRELFQSTQQSPFVVCATE